MDRADDVTMQVGCFAEGRDVGSGQTGDAAGVGEGVARGVIGSSQSLLNDADTAAEGRCSTIVVRRISGGGAMFVEPGNTITYSLHALGSLVQGPSIVEFYAFLDD